MARTIQTARPKKTKAEKEAEKKNETKEEKKQARKRKQSAREKSAVQSKRLQADERQTGERKFARLKASVEKTMEVPASASPQAETAQAKTLLEGLRMLTPFLRTRVADKRWKKDVGLEVQVSPFAKVLYRSMDIILEAHPELKQAHDEELNESDIDARRREEWEEARAQKLLDLDKQQHTETFPAERLAIMQQVYVPL